MVNRLACLFVLLFSVQTAPLSAAEKSSPESIAISETGVGPINQNTPFELKAVQNLLPRFNVTSGVDYTEGEEFPILKVSDRQGLLLTINPGDEKSIFSVVAKSNRVKNELGVRIGDSYAKVYGNQLGSCSPGTEEFSATVFCMAPGSKHVIYLFVGKWDGPDGQMPPIDVLRSWKVKAIFWQP